MRGRHDDYPAPHPAEANRQPACRASARRAEVGRVRRAQGSGQNRAGMEPRPTSAQHRERQRMLVSLGRLQGPTDAHGPPDLPNSKGLRICRICWICRICQIFRICRTAPPGSHARCPAAAQRPAAQTLHTPYMHRPCACMTAASAPTFPPSSTTAATSYPRSARASSAHSVADTPLPMGGCGLAGGPSEGQTHWPAQKGLEGPEFEIGIQGQG